MYKTHVWSLGKKRHDGLSKKKKNIIADLLSTQSLQMLRPWLLQVCKPHNMSHSCPKKRHFGLWRCGRISWDNNSDKRSTQTHQWQSLSLHFGITQILLRRPTTARRQRVTNCGVTVGWVWGPGEVAADTVLFVVKEVGLQRSVPVIHLSYNSYTYISLFPNHNCRYHSR